MPIEYKKKKAFFKELVTVEEAEVLLDWLNKFPDGKVDLRECTHIHAANLQVLMACKVSVVSWPQDTQFRQWLETALVKV